jgi:primosomal replication protein N
MSPVTYELGSYIPVDGILHSHRRENLKSNIVLTGWAL